MEAHAYQLNEQQIVEHFAAMEKKFKRHTGDLFFPSLDYTLDLIDSGDSLKSLKGEIERMVLFVGLGTMPVKLKVFTLINAAAMINMSNTDCIDITIDRERFEENHFDTIMATVAHELSHKVLYMNDIWFYAPLDFENEIYADLATFYLGFGKFTMINYQRKEGNKELKSGYLTPDTYAMAYVLSEYMNGRVPSTDGLPAHAVEEVNKAIQRCSLKWLCKLDSKDVTKDMFEFACRPLGTASLLLNLLERVVEKGREEIANKSKMMSDFYYDKNPIECRKAQMALRALESDYNPDQPVGEALVRHLLNSLLPLMDADIPGVKEVLTDASQLTQRCPVCHNMIPIKEEWAGRSIHTHCRKKIAGTNGVNKECDTHIIVDNNLNDVYQRLEERRHANESAVVKALRKPNWFKRLFGKKE